jgi:hypothetical protein
MPSKTIISNYVLDAATQGTFISPSVKITGGLVGGSAEMQLQCAVGASITFRVEVSADNVTWPTIGQPAATYSTGYIAKTGGVSRVVFDLPNVRNNWIRMRITQLTGNVTVTSIVLSN